MSFQQITFLRLIFTKRWNDVYRCACRAHLSCVRWNILSFVILSLRVVKSVKLWHSLAVAPFYIYHVNLIKLKAWLLTLVVFGIKKTLPQINLEIRRSTALDLREVTKISSTFTYVHKTLTLTHQCLFSRQFYRRCADNVQKKITMNNP